MESVETGQQISLPTVALGKALDPMPAASGVLEVAECYAKIDDPDTYRMAATDLSSNQTAIKKLDEARKAITRPLDEAKKATMALFQPAIDVRTKASNILRRALLDYDDRQEQERRKRQAEADAEADRQRRALAEEAARKRAETDAQVRELSAQGAGQTAALVQAKGHDEARELEQAANTMIAPVVDKEIPGAATYSLRWHAEVTDPLALLREVVEGRQPLALVEFNMSALNKMAIALKDQLRIPGVVPRSEKSVSARRV